MFAFTLAIVVMVVLAALSGLVLLVSSQTDKTPSSVKEFTMAVFFVSSLNLVANGLVFGLILGANSWLGIY